MTEKCLENAAVILKQVLEENKFPLYKSENDKLYKKQDGTYRRIKRYLCRTGRRRVNLWL